MWYVKKEHVDDLDTSDLDKFLQSIHFLIKEGEAVQLPTGKSTLSLTYGMKLLNEGYEFVHLNI